MENILVPSQHDTSVLDPSLYPFESQEAGSLFTEQTPAPPASAPGPSAPAPTQGTSKRSRGFRGPPESAGQCTRCPQAQDVFSFTTQSWHKQCHRHANPRPEVIDRETFYNMIRDALAVQTAAHKLDNGSEAQILIDRSLPIPEWYREHEFQAMQNREISEILKTWSNPMAERLRQMAGWRFVFKDSQMNAIGPKLRYRCSQDKTNDRKRDARRGDAPKPRQDRRRTERFDCQGRLDLQFDLSTPTRYHVTAVFGHNCIHQEYEDRRAPKGEGAAGPAKKRARVEEEPSFPVVAMSDFVDPALPVASTSNATDIPFFNPGDEFVPTPNDVVASPATSAIDEAAVINAYQRVSRILTGRQLPNRRNPAFWAAARHRLEAFASEMETMDGQYAVEIRQPSQPQPQPQQQQQQPQPQPQQQQQSHLPPLPSNIPVSAPQMGHWQQQQQHQADIHVGGHQ